VSTTVLVRLRLVGWKLFVRIGLWERSTKEWPTPRGFVVSLWCVCTWPLSLTSAENCLFLFIFLISRSGYHSSGASSQGSVLLGCFVRSLSLSLYFNPKKE
jgi:hypothetical protein